MKVTGKTESAAKVRAQLARVKTATDKLIADLSRLRGITDGGSPGEPLAKSLHRAKSVVGYRKYVLKSAAMLHTLFASVQEAVDSAE